ncbi:MAG: c-type cytochrome [Tahibacter sp.]
MNPLLRRFLIALVAMPAALSVYIAARSEFALRRHFVVDEPELAIPANTDALLRGQHLAATRGCLDCHGADLGGRVVFDAAIGRMAAPNLTSGRGGIGASLDARAWETAVRHGVRRDGRSALFMPAKDFSGMSDADLADLVAFARSVPPVDREVAESRVSVLGRALFAFGRLPALSALEAEAMRTPHAPSTTIAPTAQFGEYLAQVCAGCHGKAFSGGPIAGAPPRVPAASNLTPDASGLATWTRADFARAVREGIRPDGSTLNPFMPVRSFAHFDEVEIDAMWTYFRSLPARATGER